MTSYQPLRLLRRHISLCVCIQLFNLELEAVSKRMESVELISFFAK